MFDCDICGKSFTTKYNRDLHVSKKSCKDANVNCEYCDKSFTTTMSKNRHIKNSCKNKPDGDKEKIYEQLLVMKNEIEQLKKENKKLRKIQNNGIVAHNSTINSMTNHGTVNNINNILLIGYGKEDISKIDKNDLLKGIRSGFNSTLKLTDSIHFNPKFPEYHNVYISSMKNKYAMMYDGDDWTLVTKDELIDKLYDDKKNYIEENLDDFIESLSESQKKALERWMELDDDHIKVKQIKEKLKLLLYNKRDVPLKTLTMIKDTPVQNKTKKIPTKRQRKVIKDDDNDD